MNCNICQHTAFRPFGIRKDGVQVLQCIRCGLGVPSARARAPAAPLAALDAASPVAANPPRPAWAKTLLQLLAPEGRVLDLASPDQPPPPEGDFDAVVALMLLHQAHDLRQAFIDATTPLRQDGFLLFELPLLPPRDHGHPASNTPLGIQRHYPSEQALRRLIESDLGHGLVYAVLPDRSGGQQLIGMLTRHGPGPALRQQQFSRITAPDTPAGSTQETLAALQLRLLHAAQADRATVRALSRLPQSGVDAFMLAGIAGLWEQDLHRLEDSARRVQALEAERLTARRPEAAAAHDDSLDSTHRLAAARQLDELYAQREALTLRLQAIESSTLWRAMNPVRRFGIRYPRLARRLRQIVNVGRWTLQGTLPEHVRAYRSHRALVRGGQTQQMPPAAAERAAVIGQPDVAHGSLVTAPAPVEVLLLEEVGWMQDDAASVHDADGPADHPLVSVVIQCFNYGHLVADAIASVFQQSFADLELIVVEGGSTSQESRAAFDTAVTQAASPRLRVVYQQKPYRAGANRNTGISHARGKYICCLDADDRLAPTYIEKAVFLLEQGYDVVSSGLRFFGDRSDAWMPHSRPTLDMLLEGNQVLTCALFRKALWSQSGGYRDSDPAHGHLHEDWLFWVRLGALGARFINMPEALMQYRSHGNTLSNSKAVLDHASQCREVARHNADVLTPEAQLRARQLEGPARRPAHGWRAPRRDVSEPQTPTLMLVMPFLILGGAERLLSAVVAHLAGQGWRVLIVTTIAVDDSHGDTTAWFESSTHEIFHLPRFLDPVYWKPFIEHLCLARSIDIAWVVGSAFFYECLPALRLRNPRMRVADLLFNTVGHVDNNRRYADCIDWTFVENNEVRDWLVEAGESADRISLVSSGVDLAEYAPSLDTAQLRQDCGLPETPLLVGFFGRWSEEKNPLAFVEMAKSVPAACPVCFVMTGAGPLASEVRKAIDAAGFAEGRFLLKGAVPDLKPYLRACDILVLPSRLDGRPNAVMEALACGTVVIASRVGALPEMLQDGKQGYLCTPGDTPSFVRHILQLANDTDLLRTMQRAARAWAEREFDIRKMLAAYENQLTRLLPHAQAARIHAPDGAPPE